MPRITRVFQGHRLRWIVLGLVLAAGIAVVGSRMQSNSYFYPRPTIGTYSGGSEIGAVCCRSRQIEAAALRVGRRDPRVSRILGRRFRSIGYESLVGQRVVMVQVELFGKPRSYDLDLPYEEFGTVNPKDEAPNCRGPRYVVGWYHDRASDAKLLSLSVDLTASQVIGIRTVAREHATSWVTGKPHPSCPEPKNP
jgi:hypothetical protein